MAAVDLAKKLQEELTCSVCMEYFIDPVTITCGHSFCQICLLRYLEDQMSYSCPECRGACELSDLQTNQRLGKLSVIGKQLVPHLSESPAREELCGRHQQSQKLFCQDDETAICVSCYHSKEHENHRVCPIEEAAEQHRRKFQELLNHLWSEMEQVQTVLAAEKKTLKILKEEARNCRWNLVSEFEQIRRLLDEELDLRLRKLEKDEQKNLQKLQQSEEHLIQQSQTLQALITELEEKCQSGSVELLQDVRAIFIRYVYDLCSLRTQEMIDRDRRSVRFVETPQDVPDHQDRFDNCGSVLGSPVFTSGRHYWEVEVGDKPEWEVAVCYESRSRKNSVPVLPGDTFSLIAFQSISGDKLWIAFPLIQLRMTLPICRVGVFLDYEAGVISYYNVSEKCLIYSFPPIRFSEPLRPVFSPCLTYGGRNAGPLTISLVGSHHDY
ncbi:probable E3 ubiquitin-protein ligase TRIML1 [Ornithorhynchus anatinus]|uniref:probable E3 ubiquitin-protein ligase TRIML1 n=1 Tax=Ornithorhynchus anatinus TaxID=9258 RepID=UPI000454B612|nr:probable E3 ubiquitin-protein ligase TRIML1 [Ornithorhynchus anatinus]